ncbi:hypothetical protein BCR39DRAFT_511288 [Naematelia encephala]|uniref:Uncharacterized protein n=1 Tax=Naematelia encephala TaxID=71784 RepID=A0A1Y2BLJ2_9TREE|nr:hypothetical protein BCR39DRAFT_511288 [Naematelia encephala]
MSLFPSAPDAFDLHAVGKRKRESAGSITVQNPSKKPTEDKLGKMLDGLRIDLTNLPRDYLDAYPYPAFVLISPIPPPSHQDDDDSPPDSHLAFTRTSLSFAQPFDAVWTNEKWRNLTQGRQLLECVSMEGARELGDWISGAREARGRQHGPSAAAKLAPTHFGYGQESHRARGVSEPSPGEGFWEPEIPPYEDRSAISEALSTSDTPGTGIEPVDGEHPGPSTMVLELIEPGRVTLELTKASLPIWQTSRSDSKIRLETHTFIVITTSPRSSFIPNTDSKPAQEQPDPEKVLVAPTNRLALQPRTSVLPWPSLRPIQLGISPKSITPTDEQMMLDFPGESSSTRPLFFSRDGTVSRQKAPARDMGTGGRSMDVHELLRDTDWSKTSLGPQESWPQSLKTIVSLVMQYPHQCCLWWGKDLTLIYNAPYSETIHKHPYLFGMSGPIAWAEIWNSIGPLSELVLSGTPVYKEDDFLLFKQLPHQGNGTFEAYHSWMWVPVLQEDGSFGGLWNATIDTTKKVLAERRLGTVREMGERTSIARTMKEFDSAVIEILGANPRDVPFALLYHVNTPNATKGAKDQIPQPPTSRQKQDKIGLTLAGAVGVPNGHPSAPRTLSISNDARSREGRTSVIAGFSQGLHSPTLSIVSSLSNSVTQLPRSNTSSSEDDGLATTSDQWPFKEALQTRRLVLVEDCAALIDQYPIRVWDELPNAAIVVPIANDSDDGIPSAIIVIGLSIRRPFDDDYESFIHVMRLQLASGIAAVRSYEAELQRIDELAALDRAKSLLFSNVSHELRTPLTLVAGPLDDLLVETQDGPKKEMLVMARRNVGRLTRLVSTLMDVSRLEAGRLKGSFRLVNLGTITRDLAALFRGAIERAKLRYIVEADLSPRNVFVDLEHWEKIVFNLIGNALKYTMSGFVHVTLSYTASEALLAVRDSGVGIPTSDIGLIGERFHRVQSVSRSYEGTGIGLALIKELVKLHGGALEIESATANESPDGSHGSTFRVRIPLGFDHLPRDAIETIPDPPRLQNSYGKGIVDEAMQWNRDRESSSVDSASDSGIASTSAETSTTSSRGLDPSTLYFKKDDVILLVDDSFDTRRYMRSIFVPYCTLAEARDGKEALDFCAKTLPDLIISDVMMPVLDGFGLLAALKEDKRTQVVPVIMLTARGGDESTVEGLLAGADDYVAKPFNARELVARAHMQIQLGKRRKALEEAFEERTAELRVLSEHSPSGIFRLDEDGKIIFANEAWYTLSGYPPGQEIDNWGDLISADHRRDVQHFLTDMLKGDLPLNTAEWRFSNGRWVTAKVVRLDQVGAGLKGILGTVTDITERKMHEEMQRLRVIEAEQRRVEAEEAKRQQELLIDITSHEIRNPISSLMQCSSLVKTNLISLHEQLEMTIKRDTPFYPTEQLLTTINDDLDALESIYQCGLAQERISNDVLSLGRIQLDMLQMFDVETDVIHEAEKIISIFQNEARMKRIALSLKIGESIDKLGMYTIKTDPVRLGQVVTNLLSNSIRFTSNSNVRKIELRYDLSFEPPDDTSCLMPRIPELPVDFKDDTPVYLYIAVKDSGPGLTPEELTMLFQRFSQVSPKTHTVYGGSGLGLFVCRKITDIMGGRIEVASERGKGSTFRFFVQVRACQMASSRQVTGQGAVGQLISRPSLKKRQTTPKYSSTGPKPHVLIVEDNLINQTVLARQLRHVGLTCEVASNGLEALERIRKVASTSHSEGQPFDCVLMDLEMPVMDGLTAVKHIRAEEAAGTMSLNLIIALTGNARQGQIDEAKATGMDEVIIKPYKLDDLLHKIEDMMRIRMNQAKITGQNGDREDSRMSLEENS